MSLTRVTNPMATSIVKVLGDSGGALTRDVAAEIDNLIAWAKDAPRVIHRNTATTGTVGTGLDDLHSFSLPAGSLATNGDFVEFIYGGILATNDNQKRIVLKLDGVILEDSALIDIDRGWFRITGTYIRTSATAVTATFTTVFGFLNQIDGAGAQGGHSQFHIARSFSTAVANLNSNPVIMLVQGETDGVVGGGTNDIVQNVSIIKLCQQ